MDEVEFGRYRLIEIIGAGGMGKVYKAHDTMMGRDVAIKVLPPELANEPGYRDRFRREAHIAARLTEQHIIPIHDAGEIDGRLYLVMPIITGVDLASVLKRDGPLAPQRTVRIIEQLAEALDAAHAAGLVHRDVKPSNALIAGRDNVYLIDFGIAHDTAATHLTATGGVVGTYAYLAPERLEGKADARADVYALACVLHECLTGKQPFAARTIPEYIHAHLTLDPPRASTQHRGVPAKFDDVVARGMAKDPDERFQTATELASAAHQALNAPASAPVDGDAQSCTATREPTDPRDVLTRIRPEEHPTVIPKFLARRRSRRIKIGLAAGVVMVTAAVVAVVALVGHQSSPTASPSSQPSRPFPSSSQIVLPFTGLSTPFGVAVADDGDLYVTDLRGGGNRVHVLARGSNKSTELPLSGVDPFAIAVDIVDNVYVTDLTHDRVLKVAKGAADAIELPFTNPTDPGVPVRGPLAVAVNRLGTVYVSYADRLCVLRPGEQGSAVLTDPVLEHPSGVALDFPGNIYVADTGHNRVVKVAPDSGAVTELPVTGLDAPADVAVDRDGNLFVTDGGHDRVLMLPAGSDRQIELPFTGLKNPIGTAVRGDSVYIADTGNKRMLELRLN